MLQMHDDRFWPWEYARWKEDRCSKVAGSWPLEWKKSKCLQSFFSQNEDARAKKRKELDKAAADPVATPREKIAKLRRELEEFDMLCERDSRIKQLVDQHYLRGKLIPFRRRGFESDAMLREILRRAGTGDMTTTTTAPVRPCVWGLHLPPSAALTNANVDGRRVVFMVWDEATGGELKRELESTLLHFSHEPALRVTGRPGEVLDDDVRAEMGQATHVLVLLTKGVADEGSASLSQIRWAIEARESGSGGKTLLYVYLKRTESCPNGWSLELDKPPMDVQRSLWNNEALEYRTITAVRDSAAKPEAKGAAEGEAKGEAANPEAKTSAPSVAGGRQAEALDALTLSYEHRGMALELLRRMTAAPALQQPHDDPSDGDGALISTTRPASAARRRTTSGAGLAGAELTRPLLGGGAAALSPLPRRQTWLGALSCRSGGVKRRAAVLPLQRQ